ncbi:MAG: thiamine pyrophosphate-binding protein, partial [Promethearchaeota archaeon]
MLLNAKSPLIISGGGVSRAEGWDELQEFAEYLQIPVITTIMGIGTISNQSECYLGTTMRMFASMAHNADVILSLGCKFSFIMEYGAEPTWNDSQKMIQVDIDPAMIGRDKPVTLGIVGDCKSFLTQILDEVKAKQRIEKREWLENLLKTKKQMLTALKNMASSDSTPIDPFRMVKEVLDFIDEDTILVIDGGNIVYSTHALLHLYERKPLSTLHSICMGHLGTSIPYGIGAKLAK